MNRFQGEKLTCVRGGRRVFHDLSFALEAGGALLLTGPNGSDKSSLLRIMAGLLKPAAGKLSREGTAADDDPDGMRAELHYIGHLDAVKPVLSVSENLAFWAGLRANDGGGIGAALEPFGLGPLAETPARLLSAGQRRRLALSRLIAAPAVLWLLDEPSVGLDRDSLAALEAAIARHRGSGGMVIVATHTTIDLPGAERLKLQEYEVGEMPELVW
jgi:heme exporter protein A